MKLTIEQQKLIEDNLACCYDYFNKHGIYNEDTQQTMLMRLCTYIHLYDSTRGAITTFIHTVFNSAKCHCNRYENAQIRRANKEAKLLSEVIYTGDDGDEFTVADTLESLEDGIDTVENKMLIENVYKNLSNDPSLSQRNIEIFFAYLDSGSFTFVANLYGMSKEGVRRHYYKVKDAISKHRLYDNKIKSTSKVATASTKSKIIISTSNSISKKSIVKTETEETWLLDNIIKGNTKPQLIG